ncbi:MAG: hypothetical protein ACK4NY_06540 [Spirosomataceae bacterium]
MKKNKKDILGMDNFKVTINPNFPKINLDTPEIQAHLEKSRQVFKKVFAEKI